MTKKKLLIAADVERSLAEMAAADARFEVRSQPVRTEAELAAVIGDAQIVVTRAYNKVSRQVIDAAPQLELIAQGTSGTDNIDAAAAGDRGIAIISLPGENANAVAELVIGAMISLTRTVPFYTAEMVAGRWPRDDCSSRHEMRHFALGIVGLGEVGRRVARLAHAFGMRVAAYDPYISDADFAERGALRLPSLEDLLTSSGIVTLHVPLTPETRQMIGARELQSTQRGTILISAARGEIVDQSAALAALQSNHLGGLAMDVFDPEPPQRRFPDDPRLILTPHIAGCSTECKSSIAGKLWEKISAYVSDSSE